MTQAAFVAALGKLIAGLQKHPPAGGVLSLDGKSYATADVVALLQSTVDGLNASAAARAVYVEAVKASETNVEDNRPIVRDLKQSLQITYAKSASVLQDFGLTPRKPNGTTKPEVKVAAAIKAKGTRTARHTGGKKQKAAITGNVTGVSITPIVTPEAQPAATTPVEPAATTAGVAATSSAGNSGSSH